MTVQESRQLLIQVQDGDECLVRLVGELDVYTEDELRATMQDLLARRPGDIVLDLSDLGFTDLRGLRAILWSSRLVNEHDQAMWIVGASRLIRKILARTGDDKSLKLYPSRLAT